MKIFLTRQKLSSKWRRRKFLLSWEQFMKFNQNCLKLCKVQTCNFVSLWNFHDFLPFRFHNVFSIETSVAWLEKSRSDNKYGIWWFQLNFYIIVNCITNEILTSEGMKLFVYSVTAWTLRKTGKIKNCCKQQSNNYKNFLWSFLIDSLVLTTSLCIRWELTYQNKHYDGDDHIFVLCVVFTSVVLSRKDKTEVGLTN